MLFVTSMTLMNGNFCMQRMDFLQLMSVVYSSLFVLMDLNPFSKERSQYSMWPIMLNILDFPLYICSKSESILLVGIIPGQNEPKSLDPYLAVLVEELNEMCGQTVFDSLTNEYFPLKANIIINVLDYLAQNKVFHCNG